MNIGAVLSQAWQIIWKNKILWVFGLLAGLAATGDSGSSLQFNYGEDGRSSWINQVLNNLPGWVFLLLAIAAVVLFLVMIVVSTLGRAGLMRGAWLADSGASGLTFTRLFNEGKPYFWRILVLNIIMFAAGVTLVLMLVIPSVLTLGIALLCLWPLFCLLVPFFFGLSVLSKLAIVGITGENLGVMDGLQRAWAVLRPNLLLVAAMAVIIGLGSYLVASIAGMPVIITLAPLAAGMAASSAGLIRGGLVLSLLLFLLYLPVLLVVNGLLAAYIDTTWVLVFRRLTGRAENILES